LPQLDVYFPDCGNSLNGWADRWHIEAVTARYAKKLCPICHSWQILADFTSTRLLIHWLIALCIARIANTRQWIISRVIAKSAGSGETVFTLMDALLYGP
jgi:hypothetical protein